MPIYAPNLPSGNDTYNFKASNLVKWRKALANTRDGVSDSKLLCFGDSTVHGDLSTLSTTFPTTGSWPNRLAAQLNSTVNPAAMTLGIGYTTGSHDNRWALGTGWAGAGFSWGAGTGFTGTAPSGNLVYTPNINADTYDVYYLRTGSGGSINVTATGGSASGSISTANGTHDHIKLTVSAASASTSNTVTISATGGAVYIVGIDSYLSTTKQIRVGNAGTYGKKTSDWNGGGSGNMWYGLDAVKYYAPDLSIICLGINDAGASVDPATYTTNMTTIIQNAQLSGDVILMTFPPSTGATYVTYETLYVPVIYNLANTLNCAVIDIWRRYGAGQPAGYFADTLHPNNIGYWDIAKSVAAMLNSL